MATDWRRFLVDPIAFERQYERSRHAMLGSVQIDNDDAGNLIFRVGTPGQVGSQVFAADEFQKATSYANQIGLVQRFVFDPSSEGWDQLIGRPRSGPLRYREIEEWAEHFQREWVDESGRRGGRIVLENLETAGETAAEYLRETFRRTDEAGVERYYGLISSETGHAKVLRFFTDTGDELTTEEIGGWANQRGIELFEDNKLSKRLRAVMSAREIMTTGGENYQVGLFNPRKIEAELAKHRLHHGIGAGTAAERATDGQLLAKRSFFERHHAGLIKEAEQLEQAYSLTDHSQSAIESRKLADQYREAARKLKQTIDRGYGSFNTRIGGVELFEMADRGTLRRDANGNKVRAVDELGQYLEGVLKGDIHLVADDLIPDDIEIMAPQASLTREARFRNPFSSIVEHHHSIGAKLDYQTLSAHPGLFAEFGRIREDMERRINAMFEEVARGEIPPGYLRQMQQRLAETMMPDDPEAVRAYMARTAHDRQLLDFVEAGFDIRKSRPFMRQLTNSLYESLVDSKMKRKMGRDQLIWRMPDSLVGGIATDPTLDVKPGTITWRGDRWVVSEEDFPRIYRAIGGGDLDDTLANMIRYDVRDKKLRVPVVRWPGARGELAFLDLSFDDPAVYEILNDKLPKDSAFRKLLVRRNETRERVNGMAKQKRTAGSGAEAMKLERELRREEMELQRIEQTLSRIVHDHQFLRENFLNVETGADRAIGQDKRGRFITDVFGEFVALDENDPLKGYLMPGGDPALRYMNEAEDYHAELRRREALDRENSRRISQGLEPLPDPRDVAKAGKFAGETDWETLQRSMYENAVNAAKQDELGRYINARMLVDLFRAHTDVGAVNDVIGEGAIRVLQQERAIDLTILVEQGEDLGKHMKTMRDDLIRAMIKTKQIEGYDWVGFDPIAFEERARYRDADEWENAFDRIQRELGTSYKWKQMFLKEDDERAIYSRQVLAGRELLSDVKERERSIIEGVQGFDFIMEQNFGKQAESDARKLSKAYHRARIAAKVLEEDLGTEEFRLSGAAEDMNRAFLTEAASMFEDDVAGPRVFRAIGALMQRTQLRGSADFMFNTIGASELGIGDLTIRAMIGLREEFGQEAVEVPERLRGPITREMVNREVRGQLPFSPRAMDAIARLLADEDVTVDALDLLTEGVRMADPIDITRAPDELGEMFFPEAGEDRARMVGTVAQGPLDPSASVSAPGRRRAYLGELVEEYVTAPTDELGEAIRRSILDRHRAFVEWGRDETLREDLPRIVRNYLAEALDVGEADPADAELANELRRGGRRPSGNVPPSGGGLDRRFNMQTIEDLWRTTGGRYGMLGVGAIAALGLVKTIRDRDHTINDMQGPAFLPGGNPYEEAPMQEYDIPTPPPRPRPVGGGVTYEVRARGASRDDGLFQEISEIINGPVQGAEVREPYEPPFRGSEQRDRLLAQYR